MVKFSILTPVNIHSPQRKLGLLRAIYSVAGQTYPSEFIEHIVIDDGSPVVFEEIEGLQKQFPWLKYKKNPDRLERINCYHDAFEIATNEWMVFLDSDDMLSPYALEIYNKTIEANPDYKLFNFGSLHIRKDGLIAPRGPFTPAKLDIGHEIFGKGRIVNGTFIFKREIYDETGGFPHGIITPDQTALKEIYGRDGTLAMGSPWDFSCYAQIEFPEIRPYCMVDNVDVERGKVVQELGNPFGQDMYLFYKLTRKFHSLPLDLYLYWVFSK